MSAAQRVAGFAAGDPAFAGRVAVITGAGGGFGRAFALRAAALRMRLVLADVQAEALEQTAAAVAAAGAEVATELVDVARSDQVRRLADRTYATFGAAHLVFNNAGVGGGGYLWENSECDWQWVLGVNLMGVVHGVQHFVPRMLEADRHGEPGWIVNTASIAGWLCAPLMGVYNVSKHAVVALSETLHHDLRMARTGIGVSVLCPAYVPTGIARSHRNRPAELAAAAPTASQRMAQSLSEKAVAAGRIDATQIAQLTFDAIVARRFYVFSHPQILPSVRARFDAVLSDGAPADPYADKPAARPAPEAPAGVT
jgi:NAD(P)-dependent dehydrogenase (short-subunit alcohol dehydrogenase family)